MQKPLEVVYELTPQDVARLQRYARPKVSWVFVVVVLLVFFALFSETMRPHSMRTSIPHSTALVGLALSVALPLVFISLFWLLFLRTAQRKPSADALPNARRIVRILPDKLEHDDFISMTAIQWKGFTKLDADDVLLYFLMADKSAHIIPKRAFSSLEDAEAFYQTARDYWRSALDGTPAPPPTRSTAWPPPPGR